MKPTNKLLFIYQGSTFRETYTFTNPDGTPFDLTDAVLQMQIREKKNSEYIILDLAIEMCLSILDPVNGVVEIYIPPTLTEAIVVKEALYDLEAHMMTGDVYRLMEGKVVVSFEVTKA